MINGKPELLAPAGGWEQLEYAIKFGADAVYLACEKFGMRARANNFKLTELPKVVDFAHLHGVKVHVTCNIVMHEDDIAELPAYFEAVDKAGVDALIIGDLGAMRLAKVHAPNVEIHVSTQASVSNSLTAMTWYELGAKRIVCAREMSLEAIAAIRKELPEDLEIECFVHGAMCMAYSGRCLISDYTTGRSALKGNCTQSCRWQYSLVEEKRPGEYFPIEEDASGSYIMNAQDMNMLAHLDELTKAGVDSIKIEGRNKKAYYVATVVNAYRQALDGRPVDELLPELNLVSHRPYSTGFYFGMAHQCAESIDYIRTSEWAAQAIACSQLADGGYEVEVRCRNRFDANSDLQVLSPGKPVMPLKISALVHLPESRSEILSDNTKETWRPLDAEPAQVDCANHTNERYLIRCDVPVEPGDIIRVLY